MENSFYRRSRSGKIDASLLRGWIVKTTLLLSMLSVVAISCLAQQAPSAFTDEGVTAIRAVMEVVQQASETRNGHDYVSVFSEHSTWDGPAGENAVGPANIERAANEMFVRCGPLSTMRWHSKPLAPNLVMVDLYQVAQLLPSDRKSVPAAPGLVGPPQGSNIRATLILKSEVGQWRVIAARVADIRAVNEQKTLALK